MATIPLPALGQHGDEGELYAEHHERLLRVVRRSVRASDALVEDACHNAWLILLRRQPERGATLFAWLVTTATREAWRLSRLEMQLGWTGDAIEAAELDDRLVVDGLDHQLEARRALAALADLPERARTYLSMFVAGCSYGEVMTATGATYTNVNKHLIRARVSLRQH